MSTQFIAGFAIALAPRFAPGGAMDEVAADVLNDIQHRRVKARLRYLITRGELHAHEVQRKAEELCALPLSPATTFDDSDENDPILEESMVIARELIVKQMAAEGLPAPKGLDIHARALVEAVPAIQERARQRVEEKYRAATATAGVAA